MAGIIQVSDIEGEITGILLEVLKYIHYIIVVDNKSQDRTCDIVAGLAQKNERIILLSHQSCEGVGGAMVGGFYKAIELGAQIIVKIDAIGQVDPSDIPALLKPLIFGKADYTKGRSLYNSLSQMSTPQRLSNMGLSFLAKVATGYWNCSDPGNKYLAIRTDVLLQLPFERIDKSVFFEISMLSHLYLINAYVLDVPLSVRYPNNAFSLSVWQSVVEIPAKLFVTFLRRILLKYYLYDFSIFSIYLLIGLFLVIFGVCFGVYEWIKYAEVGIPAPTGTVMLSTLSLILGIQLLLSAIKSDLNSVPVEPISKSLIKKE